MWLKNLFRCIFKKSIKVRMLTVVTILVVIVFTGLGFFFYGPIPEVKSELSNKIKVYEDQSVKLHSIQSLLFEYSTIFSAYIKNRTDSEMELLKVKGMEIDAKFKEIEKLTTDSLQRDLIELAFLEWEKANQISHEIVDKTAEDTKNLLKLNEHIDKAIEYLNRSQRLLHQDVSGDVVGILQNRFDDFFKLMLVIWLFVCIYAFYELSVSVIRPLNRIYEGIQKFSKGDLSYTISITDENEFGEVAQALNQMAESMLKDRMALKELIIRDSLTGLYNHQEFYVRLDAEINRSKRHGHQLSLLMMDIDGFKHVNDTYGHLAGDRVLKEVSRVLTGSVRLSDIVSRYGGEEFAVILPEADTSKAREVAERIRKRIEKFKMRVRPGKDIYITVSIGISTFPGGGKSSRELLNNADHALYAAKLQGKNKVVDFEEIGCSRENASA